MIDFKVDTDKCTQCKQCVAECPMLIIDGKTEFPEIKAGKESSCMQCQHCLAVCPEGAISILGKVPEDSIGHDAEIPNGQTLGNLMQLRRSTRRFKSNELSKDIIQQIADTALYAPTGKNENGVQFTIIDSREQMTKLKSRAYDMLEQKINNNELPHEYGYMTNFLKVWRNKQIDIIFRGAPHFILASAPKEGTEPHADAIIALSYFDLLANSNGIGTLWNGFAKYIFQDIAPDLKTNLGIPANHEVFMTMLFGESKVKFARSIQNTNKQIIYPKL